MTRIMLLVLIFCLNLGASASAVEELVIATHEAQRLRIPADQPLLPTGQRLVVTARSGMTIFLQDPALAEAEQQIQEHSLQLLTADGREIVIKDLLDAFEEAPRLFIGEQEVSLETLQVSLDVQRIQAALEAGKDLGDMLEETAAGPSGGGGEIFGMVQVISWFVDRLDVTAEAHAQETGGEAGAAPLPTGGPVSPVYEQLLAQIQIARDAQIVAHASAYLGISEALLEIMTERAASGVGRALEMEQARAMHLQARLEVAEATFNHELAIDRHQDLYGERLQKSRMPDLTYAASASMRNDLSRLPAAIRTEGRRYWRQLGFATETLEMLQSLDVIVDKVVSMARKHFDIGRASFSELSGAIQLQLQVRVRLSQRNYELKQAQAWLQAAEGNLNGEILLHPGWQ